MPDALVTTRLILLCHAATVATCRAAFPRDEPLEPRGLRQAGAAAGTLPHAAAVWCSPALRAWQTADALGVAATVAPALRDWQVGRWAGETFADLHAREPDAVAAWLADPAAVPHGGESLTELLARAAGWLEGLAGHGGPVLAITHAAVIRAAIVQAIAAPPASFWRIAVAPLSQTLLVGSGRRWTLHSAGR
mgnify:CR=1 FL=1